MKAEQRRKEIIALMMSEQNAVPGRKLSKHFGVSRQIIVRDISVLKESGHEILSTHNGYMLQNTPFVEKVFKVHHTKEQTEEELRLIVGLGGVVKDVYVWHKVYGRICAKLNISSIRHVEMFIDGVRTGKSTELMNITGGYHYHTVSAENQEILEEIEMALKEKKYIVDEI